MRRWILGIAMALLTISSVSAQGVVLRLVQSSDGTLHVVAGDVRYRVVPAPISDAELLAIGEAGAWEELSDVALPVNPFDIAGTSDVLATALTMSPEQRKDHATALHRAATARRPRSSRVPATRAKRSATRSCSSMPPRISHRTTER